MKRTTTYGTIDVNKTEGYYANPPNRTKEGQDHLNRLIGHVKSGRSVPCITVVYDRVRDVYLIVGGHRRTYAHKLLGLSQIMAEITLPNPGEDPRAVQEELWSEQHQGKPIVGKDYFYTALETDGAVLMTPTVKRAWALVEAHVPDRADREWLKDFGTSDLMFTSEKICNYHNVFNASKKKTLLQDGSFSSFFRTSMYYLVRKKDQREIRDYIKVTAAEPDANLLHAIKNSLDFEIPKRVKNVRRNKR